MKQKHENSRDKKIDKKQIKKHTNKQTNKQTKSTRKKNGTKMKYPQMIPYKRTMGEVILGNLTPLAKSIKH